MIMHKMKLNPEPFDKIKTGRKTIEMRLYDDKRKLVNVGDRIEFTHTESGEKLLCQVVALHRYDNFAELYAHLDKLALGYKFEEIANPDDMLAYYTAENIARYGVVGIEVCRL